MRVISRDRGSGKIRVRIENIDDLWHLYNIIQKDDRAYSLTQRREERSADRIRGDGYDEILANGGDGIAIS